METDDDRMKKRKVVKNRQETVDKQPMRTPPGDVAVGLVWRANNSQQTRLWRTP